MFSELSPRELQTRAMARATEQMLVVHPDRLHEGVHDDRSAEGESALFQGLGQRNAAFAECTNLFAAF